MCVWQVGVLTIFSLCCSINCTKCLQLETCKNKMFLTDSLKVDHEVWRNPFLHRFVWLEVCFVLFRPGVSSVTGCSCCQEFVSISFSPKKWATLRNWLRDCKVPSNPAKYLWVWEIVKQFLWIQHPRKVSVRYYDFNRFTQNTPAEAL